MLFAKSLLSSTSLSAVRSLPQTLHQTESPLLSAAPPVQFAAPLGNTSVKAALAEAQPMFIPSSSLDLTVKPSLGGTDISFRPIVGGVKETLERFPMLVVDPTPPEPFAPSSGVHAYYGINYTGADSGKTIVLRDENNPEMKSAYEVVGENNVKPIADAPHVIGSRFDDSIIGNGQENVINANDGNDLVAARGGADVVFAGGGDDRVLGEDGNDALYGGTGHDQLSGGEGDDMLAGEAGNDTLSGDNGNDSIYGGDGDDKLIGGAGNDILSGNAGSDKLDGGEGQDQLFGGAGSDFISGGSGNDKLYGGDGNDTLMGGKGGDVLNGGEGQDTVSYADAGAGVVVNLDGALLGTSVAFSAATRLSNVYMPTANFGPQYAVANTAPLAPAANDAKGDTFISIENVVGSKFNDTLSGDAGNNSLMGGAGNDKLYGGKGNDVLRGGAGADHLDGGEGFDTVSYGDATGGVTVDMEGGSLLATDLSLGNTSVALSKSQLGAWGLGTLDATTDLFTNRSSIVGLAKPGGTLVYDVAKVEPVYQVAAPRSADGAGDTFSGIEAVSGSKFSDKISGNNDRNQMAGGEGNDELNGRGGDDTLIGGKGSDRLDGGDGIDTASYDGSETAVTVSLTNTTAAGLLFENGWGVSTGGSGNRGGEAAGDVLLNVENLSGSKHNDQLTGDDKANLISGGDGNDIIDGGGGNDMLIGGKGADVIDGGEGDDTVNYSKAERGVNVSLEGGGGPQASSVSTEPKPWLLPISSKFGVPDTQPSAVASTIAFTPALEMISAKLDPVTGGFTSRDDEGDRLINVENLIGGDFADTLTGNAAANTLAGMEGNDALSGRAGNDVLIGGAGADAIDGGEGEDTGAYSSSKAGVNVSLQAGATGRGGEAEGDVLTSIERLIGSAHDDILEGNESDNILFGGAGSDLLDGGAGNDTLNGGIGGDTLNGGAGNDKFDGGEGADALDGGEGIDEVSYASSAAGVQVSLAEGAVGTGGSAEGDTLTGIEIVSGSNSADTLTGNNATNVLGGNEGDDAIYGGGGNDVLSGGDGNDFISGDEGADKIDGGAGADTIDGGAGVDEVSYATSKAGVQLSLVAGAKGQGGTAEGDTLVSIEKVAGSAHDDRLTGNERSNILDGGSGNDVLDGGLGIDILSGGAGRDTLIGGGGNDVLAGGDGSDIFALIGNFGVDQITDFNVNDDKLDFSSFEGLDSIDQLTFVQVEGATAIVYDGQAVILKGVEQSDITSEMFLL